MAFKAKTGKDKHRNHNTEDAIKELTAEEQKGFHIYLPVSVHTALKIKATSEGEKMKTVVLRMIEKYIEK